MKKFLNAAMPLSMEDNEALKTTDQLFYGRLCLMISEIAEPQINPFSFLILKSFLLVLRLLFLLIYDPPPVFPYFFLLFSKELSTRSGGLSN